MTRKKREKEGVEGQGVESKSTVKENPITPTGNYKRETEKGGTGPAYTELHRINSRRTRKERMGGERRYV